MVGVLIQMKLTILRHSMTGTQGAWMVTGGLCGLVLAAGTILLSTLSFNHLLLSDLLCVAFAMWTFGWVLGPIWIGGESALRADYFTLLPLPRYRLALGLLGTAFVGIATAVTFLAFTSLLVYAVRLGVGPAMVAIPALLLQLVFVLALSRVVVSAAGAMMQSRAGGAIFGLTQAAMQVVLSFQWIVILAIIASGMLKTGFSPAFSTIIRVLPSSWGMVAIDAAQRSDWLLAVSTLVGLIVLIALLLAWWSRLLSSPRKTHTIVRGSSGSSQKTYPAPLHRLLSGGTGAVMVKELRTWWRDPSRTANLVLPPAWAFMICLLPLTWHSTILLPFAGPATALMAAACFANLYGLDGTALWLTLLTPGAARHDVRGRQWAWLVVFATMTIVSTVVLTALSGQDWAWPWVLALLPSLLGGGAGLLVMFAVLALSPGLDPRQGRANPMDQSNSGGLAIVLFYLGLLLPVPAALVVLVGTLLKNDMLCWIGVPIGIGSGVFLAWWFGRIAYQRLEARGPELLSRMRSRKSDEVKSVRAKAPGARSTFWSTMPPWKLLLLTMLCPALGSIALFPQGIVPLIIKFSGGHQRVWFLPLYLPEAWQWPAIIMMILIGLLTYGIMIPIYLTHKKTWRRIQIGNREEVSAL